MARTPLTLFLFAFRGRDRLSLVGRNRAAAVAAGIVRLFAGRDRGRRSTRGSNGGGPASCLPRRVRPTLSRRRPLPRRSSGQLCCHADPEALTISRPGSHERPAAGLGVRSRERLMSRRTVLATDRRRSRRRALGRLSAIAACSALLAGVAAIVGRADAAPPKDPHRCLSTRTIPSAWPKGLEPISAAELLRLVGPVAGRGLTARRRRRSNGPSTRPRSATAGFATGRHDFVVAHSGAAAALRSAGRAEPATWPHPRWIVGDESAKCQEQNRSGALGDPIRRAAAC